MYLQNTGSPRRQFLETFALSGRKTDNPTTIIQALTLMNGSLVGGATSVESSRTLAAVVELPGLSQTERVEALYLAALGRLPKPEETRRAIGHIETGGTGKEKERYADVLVGPPERRRIPHEPLILDATKESFHVIPR